MLMYIPRTCFHDNFQVRQYLGGNTLDETMSKRHIISVEGNIGSGKTTFLNMFAKEVENVEVLMEPVTMWQDVNGHNLLSLMYEDPGRHTFAFQMYAILTTIKQKINSGTKDKIVERLGGGKCFIELSYQMGTLNDIEYSILTHWIEHLKNSCGFDLSPDIIIYLKTEPETAYERIVKRNRPEEKGITLDYITKLHILHEEWLMAPNPATRVIVVDANKDMVDNPYLAAMMEILQMVK